MKRQLLSDKDISSKRNVTRRTVLYSLGAGAAAIAATIGTPATAQTPQSPKPADPCRDQDRGPSDTDGCRKPPVA